MEIFIIGHYSHTKEEFFELLELAEIEQLFDVRAFPDTQKVQGYTTRCTSQ
ncbi:hypothetical protein [Sporosarcina sp. FSL W7-1349]|uniref:hypothetical protein n=1 Tax=Sporosarcina sp. FSL W7-1349 TaxID=2921561 RepID=UPI004046F5A5